MTLTFRPMIKTGIATVASIAPQARYSRTILVLSHMRAATTALSNVLCSHEAISGYGETHVRHDSSLAPARVLVNLALRHAYSPGAPMIFDKVLHDRLDADADESFFTAKAIFMARRPGPAIRSICALAARTGMEDVAEHEQAALYYRERLGRLVEMWDRFPRDRRIGLTAEALLTDPDTIIPELGKALGLPSPLRNEYKSHAATQKGGGGDPTRSAGLTRIEKSGASDHPSAAELHGVSEALASECESAYLALERRFKS